MLAGPVDGGDDGKFDEDEPSVLAPSPATTIGGFDFHFGRASEGQYTQRREKVSVKAKIPRIFNACYHHSLTRELAAQMALNPFQALLRLRD